MHIIIRISVAPFVNIILAVLCPFLDPEKAIEFLNKQKEKVP